MALIVICENCGFVIYNGELKSVITILNYYGWRCPRCLKRLHFNPEKIEIKVKGR